MKTFIKISDNTIININNIIEIIKTEVTVNDRIVYCIKYYATDCIDATQYFNSKEERDNFFTNICNDLMY